MIITNRYDNLMAQAKKYRNNIDKRTTRDNNAINKLQSQILAIKYKREVYITKQNQKLTDVNSLIANEQTRILKDKLGDDYDKVTKR